jgi:hypothetical protein
VSDISFALDEKEAYRFDEKIEPGDKCHEWMAAKDAHGYGQFRLRGKLKGAHVLSWQRNAGREVRKGLQVNHLCKNESCVNADHLQEATPRENVLHGDSFASKNLTRTHCPSGHEYTEANCRPSALKAGWRECITCSLAKAREQRALLTEAKEILGITMAEYRSQFGSSRGVALDIIKRYG